MVFWDRCRRPLTHTHVVNRSKEEIRIDESKKAKKTCIAKLEVETVKGALAAKRLGKKHKNKTTKNKTKKQQQQPRNRKEKHTHSFS